MSEIQARKAGCENCRARHVKCEGGVPCVQCNKRGLACSKASQIRFRQVFFRGQAPSDFPAQQVWCNTSSRKLDYVDQTLETTRHYHDPYLSDEDFESTSTSRPSALPIEKRRGISRQSTTGGDADFSSQDNDISGSRLGDSDRSQPGTHGYPRMRPITESEMTSTRFSPTSNDRPHTVSGLRFDLGRGRLSHCDGLDGDTDIRRALQSFVESIGPSIDPSDQYAALAGELIERALMSPQLLSAVMWLGKTRQLDNAAITQAHPHLNEFELDKETALASAFLFRLIENVQGMAMNATSSVPSKTIRDALENLQIHAAEESRFFHKMIWANLRQELFLAITNHDETAFLDLHMETLQNLQNFSNDEKWTNQIFLQLISAVRYFLGDEKNSTVYDQLVEDLALWMRSKPSCFSPILFQLPQEGQMFHEICFLNDFAALASQYYHIVRILLIAHNPRMPKLGPAKREAAKWSDDQIKSDVKLVCAIAVSQNSVVPTYLQVSETSCMAIAMAGDRFTHPDERASLLDILVKAQHRYGWSTLAAQNYLKDCWDLPA